MIERLVFMGTPAFAVPALEGLSKKFKIVGVYTQPDRPVGRGLQVAQSAVKKKAIELKIPVYQPEKLTLPGEAEKLAGLKPDVIVVAAYGQILKTEVLNLPRHGCINIHSSLLPRWRGAAPIHWAILAGDPESGITVMKMNEGLDTGDILLQESTPISPKETAQTLHDRLAKIGGDLVVSALVGLVAGSVRPTPQEVGKETYAKKLTKDLGFLRADETAEVLGRKIRALNPWPGTSIELEDHGRLKIFEANPLDRAGIEPGQLTEKNGMILLGTAQGALELRRMQWEGKSPIGPVEFLNGLKGRGLTLPLRLRSKPQ